MSLELVFPNLQPNRYRVTSAPTIAYNCIAWAAHQDDAWWWPDPYEKYYWPANVAREETLEAFAAAFGSIGFVACDGPELECGIEKVAIFAVGSMPTHAARQLPDGKWTSKLGQDVDIEHDELTAIAGSEYGTPVLYLRRVLTIQPIEFER